MGQFDTQIMTAARLIKKNGQAVTWRRVTDGTPPDPSRPWRPGLPMLVDTTVYIVFLPEGQRNMELLALMRGMEVPSGSLIGLMAAQSFTPTLKDTVIRGGEHLALTAVDPLAPNDQTIMYTLRFAA